MRWNNWLESVLSPFLEVLSTTWNDVLGGVVTLVTSGSVKCVVGGACDIFWPADDSELMIIVSVFLTLDKADDKKSCVTCSWPQPLSLRQLDEDGFSESDLLILDKADDSKSSVTLPRPLSWVLLCLLSSARLIRDSIAPGGINSVVAMVMFSYCIGESPDMESLLLLKPSSDGSVKEDGCFLLSPISGFVREVLVVAIFVVGVPLSIVSVPGKFW